MELSYTQTVKSSDYWYSKGYGAIFVKGEENIPKVFSILVDQDDYWENYENNSSDLIKVLPNNPDPRDLENQIEYIGKRDIDDMKNFYRKLECLKIEVFVIYKDQSYID